MRHLPRARFLLFNAGWSLWSWLGWRERVPLRPQMTPWSGLFWNGTAVENMPTATSWPWCSPTSSEHTTLGNSSTDTTSSSPCELHCWWVHCGDALTSVVQVILDSSYFRSSERSVISPVQLCGSSHSVSELSQLKACNRIFVWSNPNWV